MAGGGCAWSRRLAARMRSLRGLVRDTQRALHDVSDILHVDPEFVSAVRSVGVQASHSTALVLLGSNAARARLLHCLLGRCLLPDPIPSASRWVRIQYGGSTAVHLTLGNSEFELVEDLECNKGPWDTIPVQDLIRNDQTDLSTVLEIELNNNFLKDGFKIILPPNIEDSNTNQDLESLKKSHSDLLSKREAILKNYNLVYLYAVDKIGKGIFSENFCGKIEFSKSNDDFWTIFNLYNMGKAGQDGGEKSCDVNSEKVMGSDENWCKGDEPYVFTPENCLDFYQIKQINPNSQLLFVLLSDSTEQLRRRSAAGSVAAGTENTESTEQMLYRSGDLPESDQGFRRGENSRNVVESPAAVEVGVKDSRRLHEEQVAFMNDLLDQWEAMTNPIQKHFVKSQWSILNDKELMNNCHLKLNPDNQGRKSERAGNIGDRVVKSRTTLLNVIVKFATDCLQSYLLEYCTRLSEVHIKLVQQFILASFDLARELQVVPKKIQFVAKQEQFLYETIHAKFTSSDKKRELLQIMQEVLDDMKTEVANMDWSVDDLPCHQDDRFLKSNSFYASSQRNTNSIEMRTKSTKHLTNSLHASASRTFTPNDRTFDPNLSTFDPNMGTFDPSKGTFDPSKGTFDPSKGTFDPSKGTFDPMKRRFDPNLSTFGSVHEEDLSDGEEAESYDSFNFDDYEVIESNDDSLMFSYYGSRSQQQPSEMNSMSYGIDNHIHIENESEPLSLSHTTRADLNRMNANIAEPTRLDPMRSGNSVCTNSLNISTKEATIDVQQTVLTKLSRKISLKLVKFVDCLRDSYFGTLQRCLDSLESRCVSELPPALASVAARQLAHSTRRLHLAAAASSLSTLLASLRHLAARLRHGGGGARGACCPLSARWRRSQATSTLSSLTAHSLARIVSAQILERLSTAHERYQSALTSLESALANRLHHTEDVKLAIRKKYAPGFARLCLESTSMCDVLMYGTPELGREIGRGQYGVVYSVRGAWAGTSPVAVKSLLPADDRHYQELAMEFFYTRSIPRHPRIVPLLGSVVSRSGPGGGAPGGHVLLVSPRMVRDLHSAVRQQLSFYKRMRIANDIVSGIRYLHSLGLVHRDIKMKNVLLDADDRASLSDLGFCTAESLMSGSVVGTPVHMAPELLAGDYCAAVDVYAFGILFWYLCAGSVKLPAAFEAFQNKEQLWSKVKRGLRPERLASFPPACWEVMQACWRPAPDQRMLLGDLQRALHHILLHSSSNQPPSTHHSDASDDDNIDF